MASTSIGTQEHRRHLDRQCEKIADLAPAGTFEVIVQMAPSADVRDFVETSAEILRRRLSIVSARELIPPQRTVATRRRKSRGATAAAHPADEYFRSQFETTSLAASPKARRAVEKAGRDALAPLLGSQWTKDVLRRSRGGRRTRNDGPPKSFWSARAAVIEVTREELRDLPQNVPMVTDIYPNRRLRIPPVTKASPDRPALVDYRGYTWGLSRTGALSCWGSFGARGKGVLVAVLDTGVDASHPDLKGKVQGFAEFDTDGSIIVDDVKKAYDSDRHGTHCAGIVAGGNASGRWIGMAPEAKVLAGLVLKGGAGTDAQILGGMEWAMASGAHVISMSLGGLRMSADVLDLYTRAIINANRLGIPVVVAVGNEGSQTTGSPGNDYFAFTVGATDVNDLAAGFSGGRTQIIEESRYIDPKYMPVVYSKPDVSAPGVDVYSAVPKGKWEAWNGTSMATPHVAGAMALLLSAPSTLLNIAGSRRVDLVQNLLISSVAEFGESGQNHRFGYGRIDVLNAMGYAQSLGYLD